MIHSIFFKEIKSFEMVLSNFKIKYIKLGLESRKKHPKQISIHEYQPTKKNFKRQFLEILKITKNAPKSFYFI